MSDVAELIERLKLQAEIGLLDAAELPGFKVVSYSECAEALSSLSSRIEELERERDEARHMHGAALAGLDQEGKNHWAQRDLAEISEAKLAKAVGALETALTWHEDQDKSMSKQPPSHGPNGNQWSRLQHREQMDELRAVLTEIKGGE